MSNSPERGVRESVVGVVTSDRMDKTIVVQAGRVYQHPRYQRFVRRATTYKVHDEKNEAKVGDRVEIMSTRPLSKTKSWRLVRILEKGEGQ